MVASVGVITAGRGYNYLTKEVATSKHGYYTGAGEAPGQWAGRAAALLGLSGEVDADDMAALYGRFVVPSTAGGTRLPSGRWEREQVLGRAVSTRMRADGSVLEPMAALDVTFSPSKSVSLLWALSSGPLVRESVVDAHEAAVATALEYPVGVAADGNPMHVDDLIQTRRNTRQLATSDGRRVLNRDVWRVTASTPGGGLIAVHIRSDRGVTITPEYAAADVVLAYATTIAGAQGRTADCGHVLVTPRTSAQALYVGMTRGRDSNIAHVVCDGHDHEELGLGERSPRDAFTAAMQRDPDGNLSAHTIAERWHAERPARNAARAADRQLQQAETFWNKQLCSLPTRLQRELVGEHTAIVRVLARLDSDTRCAACEGCPAAPLRRRIGASEFVALLSTVTQTDLPTPEVSAAVRSPTRAQSLDR